MGSVTMPANRILLAVVFILGVSCQNLEDVDKKPAVVDWEQNNFGIRTAHSGSQEDLLNKVNIDSNAPKIPKRAKTLRHQPRRKLTKPIVKRNELRVRSRSRTKSDEKPTEPVNTNKDHREQIQSSSKSKIMNSVVRRKSSRSSSEPKSRGTDQRREGLRSARLRSRISPRIRATTESVLKVNTIEENLESSLKVKTNFADFKDNFLKKTSSSPKDSRQRNINKIVTSTETTASPPTSITTTGTGTTMLSINLQNDLEELTTTMEIAQDNDVSSDVKATSVESISLNTIIDDAVEFVTQANIEQSKKRKKWVEGKHHGDRIIPEIGDPAVAEKLNRLTLGQAGDIKRNRKPENAPSRRISIARSRGTIRTSGSSDINKVEEKKVTDTEAEKLRSRSSIRSRVRRPPGIKHQFRSNNRHKSKDSSIPKSIKRMRIKSSNRKVAKEQPASDESEEEVNASDKLKTIRPARLRVPTGRRGQTTRTEATHVPAKTVKNRLRNPTGRRDHSMTTRPTTTTTEKITISPNAHKISYTLNDSEYAEITSENPIVPVENISELSNIIEDDPSEPFAQELIMAVPIPDNMFSQATHQLMRAKKKSVETFLPTLVPQVRKTPPATVFNEVTIGEAGTKQTEEEKEESEEVIADKPVKRGRYILAATSNG